MTSNTTPPGRLANKVCIITGAGGGFGERMARTFAREGAHVVVAEISPTAGERVARELQSTYTKDTALFHQTDVTSRTSWASLLAATLAAYGRVDVLVNNAGTTYARKPSHEVTDEEWGKVLDLNMKSIFLSVGVVVPYFMEQGRGVVLNTSSVGGIRVKDQLVWYGATKAFVNKITEGLASEYGHSGIRVNSVCPILGYTSLTELRARFVASVPMGKALEHTDTLTYVANAAVYLCSDEAAFVSGVNLPVDGAATVHAPAVGK